MSLFLSIIFGMAGFFNLFHDVNRGLAFFAVSALFYIAHNLKIISNRNGGDNKWTN